MLSKVVDKEAALASIHDGQTLAFSEAHGMACAQELIDGILEKGVKELTLISITAGNPDEGVGKLICEKRVKKLITTHTGVNPEACRQMFDGTLEIEYCPIGTWIERLHCGASGLGGCLTPTGLGTEVEKGKQKVQVDGRDYLLEKPLRADVALVRATRADKAGNVQFRMNTGYDAVTLGLAANLLIVEAETLVEVGEIGPEEIALPAPVVDMVYVRTGEKRPMPIRWQKLQAKAKGGA